MKRSILSLVLVGLAGAGLFALDFGVTETSATVALQPKANAWTISESSKTLGYLTVPLGSFDLRVEGVMDFNANWASDTWTLPPLRFDVGTARLHGLLPLGQSADGSGAGVLELSLGRQNVSDLSGWVLGGKMDGAHLGWFSGKAHAALDAFYTGLVLKKNSRVSIGAADAKDAATDSVAFAPSRVVGSASFGLNELFARQDVTLEAVGNYDLRSATAVHSGYATLGISGPLFLGFRHRTSGTGGLVSTDSGLSWSSLASTEWTTSMGGLKLVLDGAWARGWLDASADFAPIAARGMASVTSLPSSNGARIGVDVSTTLAPKLNMGLKGDVLFRGNPDRTVALPGFVSTSTAVLLGEEASWYGSWSLTSEFSLGWTAGAFLPAADAVAANTSPTYLAVLTATLEL